MNFIQIHHQLIVDFCDIDETELDDIYFENRKTNTDLLDDELLDGNLLEYLIALESTRLEQMLQIGI